MFSCNNNTYTIKQKKIQPIDSISEFSESLALTKITYMVENDDKILAYDEKLSKIIILNKELKFISSFGEKGRARNEFIEPTSFKVHNDTIIVKDPGHQRYNLFDMNGSMITSIRYPDNIGASQKIEYFKGSIIDGAKENIFTKTDSANSYGFAEIVKYSTIIQSYVRNNYQFHILNSNILAVSTSSPFVNVYDENGGLKSSFNYQSIDYIVNQQRYSEANFNKNKTYFSLICDSYLCADKLYLLTASNMGNGYFVNNILVLHFKEDNFTIENSLKLNGNQYSSIAVTESHLYAFNVVSSHIELYEL